MPVAIGPPAQAYFGGIHVAMRTLPMRAHYLLGAAVILSLYSPKAFADCDSVCTCPDCPVKRSYEQGRWFIVETESFQVCCDESRTFADGLAKHAECLRSELRSKWLAKPTDAPWNPKCQIVVHGNLSSYVSAVGRGSERTVGSSLVKADDRKILSRRIDLRGGMTDFMSAALPHELTHVVLKERFANTSLPRWADEGIAILADPEAKQQRHRTDLQNALANGTNFAAGALLVLDEYPRPDQFGIFYGQSASLTEFLVKRKTPEEFVDFIERATIVGYDSALRSCYDIANVRELDSKWRKDLSSSNLSYSHAAQHKRRS